MARQFAPLLRWPGQRRRHRPGSFHGLLDGRNAGTATHELVTADIAPTCDIPVAKLDELDRALEFVSPAFAPEAGCVCRSAKPTTGLGAWPKINWQSKRTPITIIRFIRRNMVPAFEASERSGLLQIQMRATRVLATMPRGPTIVNFGNVSHLFVVSQCFSFPNP